MTTIKATCQTCGEVSLTPADVELRVDRSGGSDSYYAFSCPGCETVVRKPADDRVVRLLVSGGVPALDLEHEPAPLVDVPRFFGPVISHDDLLDFHTLLSDPSDAWFSELRAMVRSENAA